MQSTLKSTDDAGAIPQRLGVVSTIFREYRNHFGLFWRVMLPVIIASLIFNISGFFFFKLAVPETLWTFSTSAGVKPHGAFGAFPISDTSSGASPLSREPIGIYSARGFNGSSFNIGFLWLAMCPLAFIIVHRHRGVNISFDEVWRQTLRKTLSILGGCVLLVALVIGIGLIVFPLTLLIEMASIGFFAAIFLFVLIPSVPIAYFAVKWSLYNQGIIIENLSTIAAFRRSSELVRGSGGQFFGMYLLLALGTMVFTTAVLGLTLLLFSIAAPEFAPLREVLQSGKFFGIFFGGKVGITFQHAPVWAIATMVAVNTLIDAVLAPIWALLTTHLYMKRAGSEQIPSRIR